MICECYTTFPKNEITCTKTFYNILWNKELPLTLFKLPEILNRRTSGKPRMHKRLNGKSIDIRHQEIAELNTFGH